MATLPKEVNFEEKVYQDLACVLGMSSFLLVSTVMSMWHGILYRKGVH